MDRYTKEEKLKKLDSYKQDLDGGKGGSRPVIKSREMVKKL
jgi:hypothetical protein